MLTPRRPRAAGSAEGGTLLGVRPLSTHTGPGRPLLYNLPVSQVRQLRLARSGGFPGHHHEKDEARTRIRPPEALLTPTGKCLKFAEHRDPHFQRKVFLGTP